MNLHPVPADDMLWVDMNSTMSNGSYMIIDASGKIVMERRFESDRFTIDTSKLVKGHYRLVCASNERTSMSSFIVDR